MSAQRQVGIGWLAALVAMAGLCMALAAARGWGEAPEKLRNSEAAEPSGETLSNGLEGKEAAAPDAVFDPGRLVGLRQS